MAFCTRDTTTKPKKYWFGIIKSSCKRNKVKLSHILKKMKKLMMHLIHSFNAMSNFVLFNLRY